MKLSIRDLKRFIYGGPRDGYLQFGNKTIALLGPDGQKIKQVWETEIEEGESE